MKRATSPVPGASLWLLALLLLAICEASVAHIEIYQNISIPVNYEYRSSSIVTPKTASLIGSDTAYVSINSTKPTIFQLEFSASWWFSILASTLTECFPLYQVSTHILLDVGNTNSSLPTSLGLPKGALYVFLSSATHDVVIRHNLAFFKSRGGCPNLSRAPFPLYSLRPSDDLVVAQFPFGDANRANFQSNQTYISLERDATAYAAVRSRLNYKIMIDGNAMWVNPFGYSSYDEYIPQIFVYATVAALAVVALVAFVVLVVKFRRDLHIYQLCVPILIILGFVSSISLIAERRSHNSTGFFSSGSSILAIVSMSLFDAATKLFVLFLSTGLRIISHPIGRTRRIVVVVICISYFLAASSSGILKMKRRLSGYGGTGRDVNFGSVSADEEEITQLIYLLIILPLMILESVFWGWSFIGVEKALTTLQSPSLALDAAVQNRDLARKNFKYDMYAKIRIVLAVAVGVELVFSIAKLLMFLFRLASTMTAVWWLWDCFELAFPFFLLIVIAFTVIPPSSSNHLLHIIEDADEDNNDGNPNAASGEDETQLQLIPIESLDD